MHNILMSVEGNVEPSDECCHPGVAGGEGGRTVGEAKTVRVRHQSKFSGPLLTFTALIFLHVFFCRLSFLHSA